MKEEWEEDEELMGREAVEAVMPEEALEAAGCWLYHEFGNAEGDGWAQMGREVRVAFLEGRETIKKHQMRNL